MRCQAIALALVLAGCGPAEQEPIDNGQSNDTAAVPGAPAANESRTEAVEAGEAATADANVSACLVQDGKRIAENRLHAIGTEPFWAADVEGRCVTYSTPEDQDGTRIWTRFEGRAENGRWTGALDRRPFVMATEPQPGCSDGMSDNRYPVAVTLTVGGEQRRGCAEPR